MNIAQAYRQILINIGKLQALGVKTKIYPRDHSPAEPSVFGIKDKSFWFTVQMAIENDEQRKIIYSMEDEIREMGFRFDTGGTDTVRDWEVDWSFINISELFNHVIEN